MKTIEERAKQWATNYPKTPDATYTNNDIEAIAKNSFIQGATEQKAIDDDERDTAVYKLLLLMLDNEKKLWLDKACKWLTDNDEKYRHKTTQELVAGLRKAMEE